MKIMSFNTQHCLNYTEQRIDFDVMARTITEYGADIVGLNEMRGEGPHPDYTDQVPQLAALTGLSHHYFAEAFRVGGRIRTATACFLAFPWNTWRPSRFRCPNRTDTTAITNRVAC